MVDHVSDKVVDNVSDNRSVRRTAVQQQRRRQRTRTIYLVSKYKGCVNKEEKKRKGEIGKRRFLKYHVGDNRVTFAYQSKEHNGTPRRLIEPRRIFTQLA